jgi:hypothetical protein
MRPRRGSSARPTTSSRVTPEAQVADLGTAARLVVAAIESLVHRFFAAGQPTDLNRFEDELVAMLSRYLHGGPRALR